MSPRATVVSICILLLLVFAPIMYARTSFQHKAEVYAFLYQTVGIGRQTFRDRIAAIDPTLYIVPVPDQGKVPQVGQDTQLGVLSVRLLNHSDTPVHLRVMEELRLVDAQGHIYAPSWVSYNENTNKLLRATLTNEIDVNTYNPDVSQYRYVVFLLPPGQRDYRLVSTDYSFQQAVVVTGPTPTPPSSPAPPTH